MDQFHAPARAADVSGETIAPPHLTAQGVPSASPQSVDLRQKVDTNCVGSVRQRVSRGIAETSAEAFYSLPVADYLAPKELAVLALFSGPDVLLSRQQIADMAPMRLCGACGRISSLMAKGLLEEFGDRIAPDTGKRQKTLRLPRDAQGDLLGKAA